MVNRSDAYWNYVLIKLRRYLKLRISNEFKWKAFVDQHLITQHCLQLLRFTADPTTRYYVSVLRKTLKKIINSNENNQIIFNFIKSQITLLINCIN